MQRWLHGPSQGASTLSLTGDKELMVASSSLPWAVLQRQGHNSVLSTACAPLLCSLPEPNATVESHRIMESLGLEKVSKIIKFNL